MPPISGSTIRANIGWTRNSNAADRPTAAANRPTRTRVPTRALVDTYVRANTTRGGGDVPPPPAFYFFTYFFTALGPTSAP